MSLMTLVHTFCLGQLDTAIYLDEVKVYGIALNEYLPGTSVSKIEVIDQNGSLGEIGQNSSLYFKNYGNGQLSTITLRGSSASQTQVLWNGLPVNSPTLGQTDFSVWPVFLLGEISVVRGSASSLFGSGAIGGSVVLDNRYIKRDSSLSLMARYGSFGNVQSGVKAQYQLGKKLTGETRAFRSTLRNDFKYIYRSKEVRQPNASVSQLGFSQRLNLQSSQHFSYTEIGFATNDREIQPTLTSVSRDKLVTDEFRMVIGHDSYSRNVSHLSFGYSYNRTLFNDSSQTSSHQIIGNYSFDYKLGKLSGKAGVNLLYGLANSNNFIEEVDRLQGDFFSLWSYQLWKRSKITLNFRESRSAQFRAFVPSLGTEIFLLEGLYFDLQGSKGFRAPSFNDLYWSPGGNPDLLPEYSENIESGFSFKRKKVRFKSKVFYSEISNWIQWIPSEGIWTPENLRFVKTRGIEVEATNEYQLGGSSLILDAAYEYLRSTDTEQDIKNQLPYVPRHSSFFSVSWLSGSNSIVLRANYTGKRFSTLSNSSLGSIDPFLLTDLTLQRHLMLSSLQMSWTFSVYNLFDVDYQNIKNVAMPGRNFLLGLTTKF